MIHEPIDCASSLLPLWERIGVGGKGQYHWESYNTLQVSIFITLPLTGEGDEILGETSSYGSHNGIGAKASGSGPTMMSMASPTPHSDLPT